MVSFYFLLLIPLISALRRDDEPDQYNILRGNKPTLQMAANADVSELRSGSFRPQKKHHLNKKNQHHLRKKKANLGEDNADYSRGKTFDEPRKESKSSESSSRSEESKSKSTSSSSETDPDSPGFIDRIFKWIETLQGNNSVIRVMPKKNLLNSTSKKRTRLRHSHFEVTSEPPDWKEKLWLMFVGKEKYPKHAFGRSSRSLQVYKGYKKNGRLVLRKAFKDIDLSELKDDPDIIYYQ